MKGKEETLMDLRNADLGNMRLEELNLTARVNNALRRKQIRTVGELVSHDEMFFEYFVPNFGPKALAELKTVLAEHNLSFAMQE